MPTLKIDGKEITVEKGTTIIRAALKLGIEIPYYCWHPGLSVAGNCRMCLVDVEKAPKPQIACHIECQDGMVVNTQTEKVKKLREHVLEFLLVNHPLDCPVCDQAGECWLQDYYMEYGLYDARVNENKIKKTKKAAPIGPTIILDSERCILCSRCVRFCDEITKTGEFGIFNRGTHSEIGIYPGMELNNKYSGNVADICPVGALTDRDFRFKMRVWYLKSTDSICPGCSRGCNIKIESGDLRPYKSEEGRVMRLKPRYNDDVNDWWMCDAGRYGYKSIDQNRILSPLSRVHGTSSGRDRFGSVSFNKNLFRNRTGTVVKECSWNEAIETVANTLPGILKKSKDKAAVFLSPDMTNEELFLAKKLFSEELLLNQVLLASARPQGDQDDFLIRSDKHPNRKGAESTGFTERADAVQRILQLLLEGKLEALFIFGQDLISLYPSQNLEQAITKLPLGVFIGSNHNQTSERAALVFPAASYAEEDGTFTNFEGRIQRIRRAVSPLAQSKPNYEIITLLAEKLGFEWGHQHPESIFHDLVRSVPDFNGMTYQEIGSQGMKLPPHPTLSPWKGERE